MSGLRVKEYSDGQEFLDELLPQLERHELENGQVISKAKLWHQNTLAAGYFSAALDSNGHLVYAAVWAPGNHMFLSWSPPVGGEDAPRLLAEHAAARSLSVTGIQGCEPGAFTFTNAYVAALDKSYVVQRGMTTYRLTDVKVPDNCRDKISRGILRTATADDDMKMLAEWYIGYNEQCLMPIPGEKAAIKDISSRARAGDMYLWILNGQPVSMAFKVRPLKYGCGVAGVYTPKERRGRGYATAMMAVLSELLRTEYDFVSLHADNNNPTSNYIYQQVGYEKWCRTNDYQVV
ncbi:hypothetical protein V1525DRAFT_400036 [Lipomyces kononenkoae]|uniref:Uncharacterized protein n=1 Tax=Lipomyces kononenkoae TaxID=34357 RepID=A0ACC3T535_LIPKO